MQFPVENHILVATLVEINLDGKKLSGVRNINLNIDIDKGLFIDVKSNSFFNNVILKNVELKEEVLVLNLSTIGEKSTTEITETPLAWHPV